MPAAEVYRVETVEPSKAPRGASPGEWCRYVLSSQRTRIVGRYCGSMAKARRNAESLAKTLNERARSGKSPAPLWRSRARARKNAAKPASNAAAH